MFAKVLYESANTYLNRKAWSHGSQPAPTKLRLFTGERSS